MGDNLLSLKWNNHKSTFFQSLSSLRDTEAYTDATLACEGKFFPVHKLVLSTCSDYFDEIFKRTPCKTPYIILKDIKQNELKIILDYMYLGEVEVSQTDLSNLVKAAECLHIKGLAVPDESPAISRKRSPETGRWESSAKKRHRESVSGTNDSNVSESQLNTDQYSTIQSQAKEIIPVETIKIEQEICDQDLFVLSRRNEDIEGTAESHDISHSEKIEMGDPQSISNDEFEKYESSVWDDPQQSSTTISKTSSSQQNQCEETSKEFLVTIDTDYIPETRKITGSQEYKMLEPTTDNAKLFECQVCPFKAIKKSDVQRHFKIHTGEKPFKCPICPYKSNRRSNLQSHRNRLKHNY